MDDEEERRHILRVRARYAPKPQTGDPHVQEDHAAMQLRLHQLVLERMSEALVVTDHLGLVTYVNPAGARLFMREAKRMEGRDVMEWLRDPDTVLPLREVREAVLRGEAIIEKRVAILRKDESSINVLMNVVPLQVEGVLVRVIGIMRDLTEIEAVNRQMRDALRREALHHRGQDQETALLKREAFLDRIHLFSALARRQKSALALIHIRVGSYDEDDGEAPPKELMRAMAESLRSGSREECVIGRVGSASFCILIPVLQPEELPGLIRKATQAASPPWTDAAGKSQPPPRIALDGVCQIGDTIQKPEVFLEAAEHASFLLRRDSGSFRLNLPHPRKPS